MKITGTRDQIKFDFENGYIAVAEGEMLSGRRFVVFTNTLIAWEPPYNNEPFTDVDVQRIKDIVAAMTGEHTAQLIFE